MAFLCDRCGGEVLQIFTTPARPAVCAQCGQSFSEPARGIPLASSPLSSCLRCGETRLYVQKDFNKKAGLWVFIVAAALSIPTWGLSLLAATLIDLALYYVLGDATLCYGCGAVHRGFRKNPDHLSFDLHVQESVDRHVRTA